MNILYEDQKARFATLPRNGGLILNNASPIAAAGNNANFFDIITAGAYGSLVTVAFCINTDTINILTLLGILKGGVLYHQNTYTVPLRSGDNGTAVPYNLLNNTVAQAYDTGTNGHYYIKLAAGETLRGGTGTAITAGKMLQFFVSVYDFAAP
ncbi:hypothetical protein QQ054_32070 [Oscillatoria amoena NRMC-F 0135]|nr:hypothetical protein [Oscillatoria amoena NRMC-F 0135]